MKLTYRGKNYQVQIPEVKPNLFDDAIVNLEKGMTTEKHSINSIEHNKVIQVKPIHYYTYRGVSYTKNLIFDTHAKLLLNINRK